MKDSIHSPTGSSSSWLAIAGSLVCLAGCAAPLTTQSRFPAAVSQAPSEQSLAQQPVAPATAFTTNEADAPSFAANPTQAQFVSAPSDASQVSQVAGTQPYVARQFPGNPPPIPSNPPPPIAGNPPPPTSPYNFTTPAGPPLPPGSDYTPPVSPLTGPVLTAPTADPYGPIVPQPTYQPGPRVREADLIINGFPARTGRIMLGGAVNSDAGVTGQFTIDERNFDICRFPRSFQDLFSGTAFRGAGQTFRIEAAPGTDFKRYTMQFADPNLFGYKPVSMSVSGFLYDRRFQDWDEERLGGRVALGYRVTPDLSVSLGLSGQNVRITRPRIRGVQQLEDALGDNEMYSGEISLKHDTRDTPIQAARGHYFDFTFEEVFGKYDYARFELEYRKYWLVAERADRTGRQTISYSTQVGFSGNQTPIFENFFAGGYSTLRGFDFRGASPVVGGVEVGGRFQWLNTLEYMFPITADDAFRGVAFVDFGTVEQEVEIKQDNYRVAPGLGLRVAIPMLGPAPLAFDFAYPVAMADTDQRRIFSFYMSLIN